jgi:twitching motility protein PilT
MNPIENWISFAREKGASDVHLEPGSPLILRIRGELTPTGEPIAAETLLEASRQLLGSARWQDFLGQRSADLSQTMAGARCRINIYQTLRGVSLAIRVLSSFQNSLRDCNLHPDLARFVKADTGLLLVCGPTGSGKSTTLASLVEEINAQRRRHIITIESPIEYVFRNRKSFIRQREVQHHTPSFEQAITDSLRQDPDVLVIGEMRTPDVMRLTLSAAETGHLVFSTIHSATCAEALARLCMSFPSDIQPSICAQVADCLVGVVCQRLTYYPRFQVRVPVCEILVASSSVKAIIRSGQFAKIASAIQTGGEDGSWTWDRYRRWADEKQDWVTAPKKGLASESEDPAEPDSRLAPPDRPPARGSLPPRPQRPAPRPAEPTASAETETRRIEIDEAGEDLEELIRQMRRQEPK